MQSQIPFQNRPFVSRERELQQLADHLSWILKNKKPRIVFIHGDFGVGKTTLVEAFLQSVENNQSILIGRGKCSYEDQDNGRIPFIQVLNGLMRRQKTGPNGKKLLNWVKEVAPGWVDFLTLGLASPIVTTIDKSIELFRENETPRGGFLEKQIFMQFTNAISELTQGRGAILFIDDLHWADESSLRMIFHLMNNLVDCAVMVVCTYRTYDIQNSPHAGVFNDIHANLLYKSLGFADLELEKGIDVLSYATKRYGQNTIPVSVLEEIQHKSDGLPIFIVELFNLWEQMQLLRIIEQPDTKTSSWQLVADIDLNLPAGIMELLKERIRLLNTELRNIITGASVEGEDFSAQTIEKLFAIDRMLLLDDLGQLERKFNLIKERGSEQISTVLFDFYRFAHRFIREYVYQNEIPAPKRREMHRRLGECLEAIFGDREPIAAQIARHFREAMEPERAVDYMLMAAHYEARRYSWAECQNWCSQGLLIIDTSMNDRTELRVKFLEQLAEGFSFRLNHQEAAKTLSTAIRFAEGAKLEPEKILHLYSLISDTYEQMEDYENYQDVIEKGKELIRIHKIPVGQFRVSFNICAGLLKVRQGQLNSAIRSLTRTVEDAKKLKQDITGKHILADALGCLGVAYSFKGDYRNSVKYYRMSVDLFEMIGNISLQAFGMANMVDDLYWITDNPDELKSIILQSKKLAYQIGDVDSESYLWYVEGSIQMRDEDFEAAENSMKKAIGIWSHHDLEKVSSYAYADLAIIYVGKGDTESALMCALKALDLTSQDTQRGYALGALGMVESQKGDRINSLRHFRESIALLKGEEALHLAALVQRNFAEALLKVGKKESALDVLGEALATVRSFRLKREEKIIKEMMKHIRMTR